MKTLSFIGGGNMTTAILAGLIEAGVPPVSMNVIDPQPVAQARLAALGVGVVSSVDALTLGETVLLAVKPQQIPEVCAGLARRLEGRLVVSIAAGVRTGDLSRWLGGHAAIVRAMPNTPAMVGAGVSGLYAGAAVGPECRDTAESLLRAVGGVVWVAEESQLDWVTAVSGSGPAYFFRFIELLEDAGIAGGLAPAVARQLALQTAFGAAKLALESGEEPGLLRERVTSRGGTTAAALASFADDDLPGVVSRAVSAAAARAHALGDELGELG
jgi:pyrroline-5-carboxylate reductase